MTVSSPLWEVTPTTIPINLAGLASSAVDAGVQSDVIDLVAEDMVDGWIGGKITLGTTPTINTRVEVWVFPSYDGISFAGGLFGATAAAVTPPSTSFPTGFKTQGILAANFSVLAATTGVLFLWARAISDLFSCIPPKMVVFVTHNCVAALNATPANHELKTKLMNFES